ncbi:MAG: NifU N-terminal domain-containing protein [Candidatus Hydrogenedentota bacterium]
MKIIRIEATPNPTAMKLVLDEPICPGGSRQYDKAPAEQEDPLAYALFMIPTVRSVYYMDDFISIDKPAGPDWRAMELGINQMLEEGLRPPASMMKPESAPDVETSDEDLLDRINEVLDARVRPALAGDGGGLQIMGLRGHDLLIRYQGACGSCPSSIAGTMYAIQNLLRTELNTEINVIAS